MPPASLAFQDLDSTKPAGSVKIRVETIAHYLCAEARSHGTGVPASSSRGMIQVRPGASSGDVLASAVLAGTFLPVLALRRRT